MTATPWITQLNAVAIHAYQTDDTTAPQELRVLGAVLNLHGIAMNGGLMGGGIENPFFTGGGDFAAVDDAIAGFRRLELHDLADLVTRARDAYARFRPTGYEELSPPDAERWGDLDEEFFVIADDGRLEQAVKDHLRTITDERT